MDIKQLKFLIALEETRHFGQAAARCHVTQPTLSMRLRSLEEELGLELVIRGQRFEGFTGDLSGHGQAGAFIGDQDRFRYGRGRSKLGADQHHVFAAFARPIRNTHAHFHLAGGIGARPLDHAVFVVGFAQTDEDGDVRCQAVSPDQDGALLFRMRW